MKRVLSAAVSHRRASVRVHARGCGSYAREHVARLQTREDED